MESKTAVDHYVEYCKDNPKEEVVIKDFIRGFNVAKKLYDPKWISVGEQEPPHNTELLVKSPSGTLHLCSWRPAYNIFTVQTKSESSYDWQWMHIKN
jgi:hypothetical protein